MKSGRTRSYPHFRSCLSDDKCTLARTGSDAVAPEVGEAQLRTHGDLLVHVLVDVVVARTWVGRLVEDRDRLALFSAVTHRESFFRRLLKT